MKKSCPWVMTAKRTGTAFRKSLRCTEKKTWAAQVFLIGLRNSCAGDSRLWVGPLMGNAKGADFPVAAVLWILKCHHCPSWGKRRRSFKWKKILSSSCMLGRLVAARFLIHGEFQKASHKNPGRIYMEFPNSDDNSCWNWLCQISKAVAWHGLEISSSTQQETPGVLIKNYSCCENSTPRLPRLPRLLRPRQGVLEVGDLLPRWPVVTPWPPRSDGAPSPRTDVL